MNAMKFVIPGRKPAIFSCLQVSIEIICLMKGYCLIFELESDGISRLGRILVSLGEESFL
jgi:hypothetical protein